ncbi:MAG: TAXI family TRAP transporter solute-binding subunit, partial [Alphaproteobacteria bacterium]|nr:TAXI family TRAP transporter solute-binding subunit [Alphaproteobacteria bacterium]
MGMLVAALGVALVGQPMIASAGDGFMLATGRTTGKSFAVGVGISSLAKVKLMPEHKMDLSAVESKGFVHNVRMLQSNQAQFAILQAMFGHFARTGTGTFAGEAPDDTIRAVGMLWRDADHFVIDKAYEKTGTIADLEQLKGMPVSMGLNGPGPIESNRLLLSHLGIDVDRAFNLAFLNYQQSSDALSRGEIKGMSTPIRPPAPHVQNVLESSGGRHTLLAFTDEQIAKADGGLGLWTPYVIPAATYPGQDQDIQTVAKSNLLVARADVDDEVVYQVAKAMFENLDFLRNIHDAMYETSLDRALVGVPMPLHPGALRYYQEIGLLGPDANLEVALAEDVRQAETAAYDPNGALKAKARTIAAVPTAPSAVDAPAAGSEAKTFVVYFGLEEKTVNGIGMQELAEVSAYADNLSTAEITISGHTDRSGDPVYNAYLAEVRAQAVIELLRDRFGVTGH